MEAQTLALTLLGLRIVAVALLIAVIIRQIKRLRTLSTEYPIVRSAVFVLTLILLVGQAVPIVLDSVVAFGEIYAGRSTSPNPLAVAYAVNNALKDVIIGAVLVFLYYRPKKA